MDNEKNIAEINEVIAKVEAGLEPGCEIGARDKMTLKGLLRANNIDRDIKFFPCQRENSAKIVAHFVRAKGIPQSRFSINAQPGIFILCQGPAEENDRKEVKVEKELRVGKAGSEEKPQQPLQVAKEEKAPKEKKTQKREKPRKEVKARKKETASKTSKRAKTAKKKKK